MLRPKSLITASLVCAVFTFGGQAIAADKKEEAAAAPSAEKSVEADTGALIAKVGEKEVRSTEVDAMLERASRQGGGHGAPGMDRERVIGTLIDSKVLEVMADKEGDTVSDAEIDQFIAEASQRQEPGAFQKMLEEQKITVEDYRDRVRPQLSVAKYLKRKMDEAPISDAEIEAEYNNLKDSNRLQRPETVDVSHILIKVEGQEESAWAEGKKKIDAIRTRVTDGGEDFEKVAREVSEDPGVVQNGGAYPNTPKGRMVPEFEKAAFEGEIGKVSEPFKTNFGWHIVKVTGKDAAGTMELAEVREQLNAMLQNKRQRDTVRTLVEEGKKTIKIERVEPPAPQEAPAEPQSPAPGASGAKDDQDALPSEAT